MFNYLHSFLFLFETDNKFESSSLEAKVSIDTFLICYLTHVKLKIALKYFLIILDLKCVIKK